MSISDLNSTNLEFTKLNISQVLSEKRYTLHHNLLKCRVNITKMENLTTRSY